MARRRLFVPLVLAAAMLLGSLSSVAWATPERARKVLLIGIDGVRPDALVKAKTPHLNRLMDTGAFSLDARAAKITLSGPGWTALLTGVDVSKHRVRDNYFRNHRLGQWPTLFERLKDQRPDAQTAAYVAWRPLTKFLLDPSVVDKRLVARHDDGVVDAVRRSLRDEDIDLTFVHLDGPDFAGHRYGYSPRSDRYLRAITRADRRIGRILKALDARPTRADESWLIVVTTDHGGTGKNHYGNTVTDRRTFFIANGPTVEPGPIPGHPRLVDTAPTVLAHLGIQLSHRWLLEGNVVALAPDIVAHIAAR